MTIIIDDKTELELKNLEYKKFIFQETERQRKKDEIKKMG